MRIMIVAAEERLAAICQAELRLHGHTVDVADRGTVGRSLVNTTRYDIVLLTQPRSPWTQSLPRASSRSPLMSTSRRGATTQRRAPWQFAHV